MATKYIDGLSSYDILQMPGCPFTLPYSTNMTSAKIDFEHIQDKVIAWYEQKKFEDKKKQFKKAITEDPFDVW